MTIQWFCPKCGEPEGPYQSAEIDTIFPGATTVRCDGCGNIYCFSFETVYDDES